MIALAPSHKSQLRNYTNWLEKLKLPYYLLATGDIIDERFSMLILCGGPDIGKKGNELRDLNDIGWFKQAYGKIPVLGICRGFQLANVVLGGTLYEDLPNVPIKHSVNKQQVAGEPTQLIESSFHNILYKNKKIKVNSRHHQGIKVLAEGLNVLAICEEDGLIEMVSGNNSLFVQWHPEREDVWGTEAEQIVSNWIKERVKSEIDFYKTALMNLGRYYDSKGFSVVSEQSIAKNINEKYTSSFLSQLALKFPKNVKKVIDKKGRKAIKLINWKSIYQNNLI